MSINDPIIVVYYDRRDTYILKRGRETFYDDNRHMREWTNQIAAIQWTKDNLNVEVKPCE